MTGLKRSERLAVTTAVILLLAVGFVPEAVHGDLVCGIILAVLTIGSYALSIWAWRLNRRGR